MRKRIARILRWLSYPHSLFRIGEDGHLEKYTVLKIIENPRTKQQYAIYTAYEDDPSGSETAYVCRFYHFGPFAAGLSPVDGEELRRIQSWFDFEWLAAMAEAYLKAQNES